MTKRSLQGSMNLDRSVVDLTEATDDENGFQKKTVQARRMLAVIGAEMSADIVDLADENDDNSPRDIANDAVPIIARNTSIFGEKRPLHSHPKKILNDARRRKRRQQEFQAAETAASVPECNFIIIDDDSDEDADSVESVTTKPPPKPKSSVPRGGTNNTKSSANSFEHHDSSTCEPPFKTFCHKRDFNYQISQEKALEMQERMIQEAAARVQRLAELQSPPKFESPMHDIATRFPSHWTWKDPYAILGLPKHAEPCAVKSQYRQLARLYHPDKSNDPQCLPKFHAIAAAYRKLAGE